MGSQAEQLPSTWEDTPPRPLDDIQPGFRPDVEGYEGPLDALLDLCRAKKIDIGQIPMNHLVDSFLSWLQLALEEHRDLANIGIALIAVAWLIDLKSRSLLPFPSKDNQTLDPTERLRLQLLRLQAIRDASEQLWNRPRLGQDWVFRGRSEAVPVYNVSLVKKGGFHVSPLVQDGKITWSSKARKGLTKPDKSSELAFLLAVGSQYARVPVAEKPPAVLEIRPTPTVPVELTTAYIRACLAADNQVTLEDSVLPVDRPLRRSALASTLVAALEMAREGEIQLRQIDVFGAIYLSI